MKDSERIRNVVNGWIFPRSLRLTFWNDEHWSQMDEHGAEDSSSVALVRRS